MNYVPMEIDYMYTSMFNQSELPRPIPLNAVESDHGCPSRIYYDNAGDRVTPKFYNLTLNHKNHVSTIKNVTAATQTA